MTKPLEGLRVVITRSSEQNETLQDLFFSEGAKAFSVPTIKIVPAPDYQYFDDAVKRLDDYSYIIFTSANAVHHTCQRAEGIAARLADSPVRVVSVGRVTAKACSDAGIAVDIIPYDFTASGVASELAGHDINGKQVFIPCSAIAREELRQRLVELGADVTKVPVYNVVIPDEKEAAQYRSMLENEKIDLYVFTSPSTYRNFLVMFNVEHPDTYFLRSRIAVIGPTTAEAVKKTGAQVDIIPGTYTTTELFQKTIEFFSSN